MWGWSVWRDGLSDDDIEPLLRKRNIFVNAIWVRCILWFAREHQRSGSSRIATSGAFDGNPRPPAPPSFNWNRTICRTIGCCVGFVNIIIHSGIHTRICCFVVLGCKRAPFISIDFFFAFYCMFRFGLIKLFRINFLCIPFWFCAIAAAGMISRSNKIWPMR